MRRNSSRSDPVDWSLVISTVLDMVHFLVFLFVAAYFVREVWNRLISDVFSVRALDTQEAIAIILLLGIFFS